MATPAVTHVFINGTASDAIQMNTNFQDLVDFLNDEVVHVDGSKAMTAALAMGGFKVTGLAAGTANGDAVRFEQAVLATLVDAKGDLIVATAADTVARLAVGTDGQILSANSAQAGGLEWIDVPTQSGTAVIKYKAADETLTSSENVLQDDNDLFFPVLANEKWAFEIAGWRSITNAGQEDFGFAFSVPAGASIIWGLYPQVNTSSSVVISNTQTGTTELTAQDSFSNGTPYPFVIRGYVEVAATAGDVKLRWRNASGASGDPAVLEGSHLKAFQLA